MNAPFQATLNALLNLTSAFLLLSGYIQIKKGNRERHQKFMWAALISSALFLVSYTIYHYRAGSVPYPYHDWTRTLYFVILVPHVILASVMVPFILAAVYFAIRQQFDRHTRITKWLWPVWMFVSVSGVSVYLMLYIL
jgi:uncharacterized membrane protein YozB (DUF420 family)